LDGLGRGGWGQLLKRLGRAALAVSLWISALPTACSVVVDPQGLQKGCAAGTKPCEVKPGELSCVSTSDPEYGCARESCVPCTLFQAVEVCGGDGECAVGTCEPDFENCDLMPKNGCEVDLDSTYDNCGACSTSCQDALRDMPRALSAECDAARCVVGTCADGYADCDGAASNGCERSLGLGDCDRCGGCPGTTQCNLDTRRCE
jgi:hypothetical protein